MKKLPTLYGPFKFKSVCIEGPLETTTQQMYFRVKLESVNDTECPMSKYIIRHFFDTFHPLIFKACENAMTNDRPLLVMCNTMTIKLSHPRRITREIEDTKWTRTEDTIFTCGLLDENPKDILFTEEAMEEELSK
jgi:hypothetical protein